MAYGNTNELDIATVTLDTWVDSNGLDLFAGQNAFVAVLWDKSMEPGAEFVFRQSSVAEGNQFKRTVFGAANTSVAGVTRANQLTAITPALPGVSGSPSLETSAVYQWCHIQGLIQIDYEASAKNAGKAQVIDHVETMRRQLISSNFSVVGDYLWDGAVGTIAKLQSVTHCLLNTGSPGNIDQTDTTNNSWWRAQGDSTVEVLTTTSFDNVRDAACTDTAVDTGLAQNEPDCAFFAGTLYSKFRNDLKSAQRTEVTDMLKGGAKYLMYDGCRCFRETKMTAGQVAIINSATWELRYKTKMPEPNAPGFVQDPYRPAIKTRGYNWFLGLACWSPKHNGLLQGKTAS